MVGRKAAPFPDGRVRRVVTGHDPAGRPVVLFNQEIDGRRPYEGAPVSTVIWLTEGAPAEIPVGMDIADTRLQSAGTAPPPSGSRFVVVDLPPHFHGALHRTETIDYGVVIDGTVELELGGGRIRLEQGSCIVQRGTDHAWHNPGDRAARVAFVLIDARPLGLGAPLQGTDIPR